MVRLAIESFYKGVCSIAEYLPVKDETSKITSQAETMVIENQPCRVSFSNINPAVQTSSGAIVSQSVKLFISPDIVLRHGSKITVTQYNVTTEYQCSGEPAIYESHQEVMLELFRGWS